jgi:hypothetical protein
MSPSGSSFVSRLCTSLGLPVLELGNQAFECLDAARRSLVVSGPWPPQILFDELPAMRTEDTFGEKGQDPGDEMVFPHLQTRGVVAIVLVGAPPEVVVRLAGVVGGRAASLLSAAIAGSPRRRRAVRLSRV